MWVPTPGVYKSGLFTPDLVGVEPPARTRSCNRRRVAGAARPLRGAFSSPLAYVEALKSNPARYVAYLR